MNRYENIKKTTDQLGMKAVKFPKIYETSADIIIVSRDGDRLDLLANYYYGDSALYWVIAVANNLGKGTLEISPGTYIRIPNNIESIIQQYENLNS